MSILCTNGQYKRWTFALQNIKCNNLSFFMIFQTYPYQGGLTSKRQKVTPDVFSLFSSTEYASSSLSYDHYFQHRCYSACECNMKHCSCTYGLSAAAAHWRHALVRLNHHRTLNLIKHILDSIELMCPTQTINTNQSIRSPTNIKQEVSKTTSHGT